MPARIAASIMGTAVSRNGPAQLITAALPESAALSDDESSTVATRVSSVGCDSPSVLSFAALRPESTGLHPRLRNSETTKRPVCPYAPYTVTCLFNELTLPACHHNAGTKSPLAVPRSSGINRYARLWRAPPERDPRDRARQRRAYLQ